MSTPTAGAPRPGRATPRPRPPLGAPPPRPRGGPAPRPGSLTHPAIHAALPRAHCVMHTHTTSGMAVACLKEGLSPHNFYGAMLHGRVAYHEFGGITVKERDEERLGRATGDKPALILRNHGLLAWGPSVPEAFLMMWTLQRACDVQIAASRAGEINPIRPEVFPQTVRESGPGEKHTCEDVFAALQRKLDAIDPSYREQRGPGDGRYGKRNQ